MSAIVVVVVVIIIVVVVVLVLVLVLIRVLVLVVLVLVVSADPIGVERVRTTAITNNESPSRIYPPTPLAPSM